MKIFYDCEFVEDGRTIDLVSIGMVTNDGRELYAVSSDFAVDRLLANEWLRENVWPSLPRRERTRCRCRYGHLDRDHPAVHPRAKIARMVEEFIGATPQPELWAWYGAYDHVALAQLWGPMSSLPAVVPMWTNDLKQECQRLGDPAVPQQVQGKHNALFDAHHNREIDAFLIAHRR